MKPLLVALLPFAGLACFDHDGSGKVITEHRQVGLFDRVEVSGAIEVSVTIDDEPTVAVETDDNLQKHILVEVRDRKLIVKQKDDLDPSKLIVRITTPTLTGFESSGAIEAKITGIDTKRFELEISGATEVELEGEVEVFVIDASGAAEVQAEKLIAERVEVEGSGASEFTVHAEETLIADLSGAGDLQYAGDPDEVKTELSGAASVHKR
jgi:hypothetical protein